MSPFLVFLLWAGSAYSAELKGVAKTTDGRQIVYLESHKITLDEAGYNKVIESRYSKPDGSVFAKMTSDFSQNKTVPAISFEDLRFNKREELRFENQGKTVVLKTMRDGKSEEKRFPLTKDMVVGQGFDNFIKMNFKSLTEDSLAIFFGVVTKLDFFNFTAKKSALAQDRVTFGINIKNRFLRLFLDELNVEYNRVTKQLVKYRGLSNLTDDTGKDQVVLIEYEKMVQ